MASRSETEDLSQYVSRVMRLKGLTQRDVQQRASGKITNGYVASIITGKAKNPSVEKMQALAQGLGVDVEELFRVACQMPEPSAAGDERDVQSGSLVLLDILRKIIVSPEVADILSEVMHLSAKERIVVLKYLRAINQNKDHAYRDRKTG